MIFTKECALPCDLHSAFAFHRDIHNLPKLSPPDTVVTLRTPPAALKEGSVLHLHAQKGFYSMEWIVSVEKLEAPSLLVDKAVKSPFAGWVHYHRFFEREGQTVMCDEVHVTLPFGVFGKLFESFVKRELEKMFTYRYRVTKELLAPKES